MLLNLYEVLNVIKEVYHDNWCTLTLLLKGRGKYNDYTAERMTSELTFSMYIQDQ